jgi:uncharacterized protein (TIGR02271 family)
MPVLRERLKVGRRRVESGRVIARTTTTTEEVPIDEALEADDIRIERVPIGRFVDAPVMPAFEGDVLVIPVMEEVIVLTRRLRIVEEVRIHRRTTVRRHREIVPLRRQTVRIERRPGNRTPDRA